MKRINIDILIAGGGSAGFGAAYRACLDGKGRFKIAVVDSNGFLGGTSTAAGVNAWEMGIGGPGVHLIIASKLMDLPNKAAILKGHWQPLTRTRPYAIHSPEDNYTYGDTLKAAGIYDRAGNHNSFMFEPDSMASVMLGLLKEKGGDNFRFYNNETITDVDKVGSRITAVRTNKHIFNPSIVIDSTGDISVSRIAGCKVESGPGLNGVTQVYRVTPKGYESIDAVPAEFLYSYNDVEFIKRLDNVRVISSVNMYPDGDLNINQLPTMDGDVFLSMDRMKAERICRGRAYLHWRRLQQDSPFMRKYRIKELFPMVGIRESYRLKGRYVMSAGDVAAGFRNQNHKDSLIAFSDHPVDIHGENGSGLKILDEPYGIPYECMLPLELDNLLVACRGSSFDSIAAASCRLSRTMIALGEAAGTAAVLCMEEKKNPADTDITKIRKMLSIPEFIKNNLVPMYDD